MNQSRKKKNKKKLSVVPEISKESSINTKTFDKNLRFTFIGVFLVVLSLIGSTYFKNNTTEYKLWYLKINDTLQFIHSVGFIVFNIIYFPIMAYYFYFFFNSIIKSSTEKNVEIKLNILSRLFFIVTILRLSFTFFPFVYNSELINQISTIYLPKLENLAIKFWSSVIVTIVIPGVVGNFCYDILKSYILGLIKKLREKYS